jgi:PAS domain S-box-containing protein
MDEALEIAADQQPELALMDIHLASGTDGVETARELVRRHECAVVFISAYADDKTVERTQEVGAAGYIVKPFTAPQVRAAIATALANHAKLQGQRNQAQALGTVLERVGGALFLVDGADRIAFANQSAADLVGWPVYKVYGRDFFSVMGPEAGEVADLREAISRARTGESSVCAGLAVRDKDGNQRVVDVAMEVMRTSGGDDRGVLLSLTDHGKASATDTAVADDVAVKVESLSSEVERRPFGEGTRLMVYSHDTFGLGHLRRSMALVRALCERFPGISVLLVTGSPMVHRYSMPPGADYVKLPALQKVGDEQYEARSLQIPGPDIRALRSNLILHTVRDYEPNVLLVDHSPTGGKGELLPSLEWLRDRGGCTRILGLRDIVDEPEHVRSSWQKQGVYELLERDYDHIAIYGTRDVFDPIESYSFPPAVAAKSSFVEYVCSGHSDAEEPPRHEEGTQPMVFVTIGGGDGGAESVLVPFLEMMSQFRERIDFRAEIVTGPFADPLLRQELEAKAEGLPVRMRDFVNSTQALLRSAEIVISTTGYNTATDVLSYARRAILIPRVLYRQEQLIRAEQFDRLGWARLLEPTNVTPQRLLQTILEMRSDRRLLESRDRGLPLRGVERFVEFCSRLQVPVRS